MSTDERAEHNRKLLKKADERLIYVFMDSISARYAAIITCGFNPERAASIDLGGSPNIAAMRVCEMLANMAAGNSVQFFMKVANYPLPDAVANLVPQAISEPE